MRLQSMNNKSVYKLLKKQSRKKRFLKLFFASFFSFLALVYTIISIDEKDTSYLTATIICSIFAAILFVLAKQQKRNDENILRIAKSLEVNEQGIQPYPKPTPKPVPPVKEKAKPGDLVLVQYGDASHVCCDECGRYLNRIMSISGTSRQYPRLPAFFQNNYSENHIYCSVAIAPFADESSLTDKDIKYNARPFKDERTPEEKDKYKATIIKNEALKRDMAEYDTLCTLAPDISPTSFLAYKRMKENRTAKFKELYDMATERGVYISFDNRSLF